MPTKRKFRMTFRLEEDLHQWLTSLANQQNRTINAQLCRLLRELKDRLPIS